MAINVQEKIKLCIDGALPLLKGICDKIGLSELIDEKLGNQDDRRVSTGKAIMTIVLNTIAQRRPLYKLERFYVKRTLWKKLIRWRKPLDFHIMS
ncbi:MAG: DUF4277 domain-containing protein [Firmicutes bacterium]|nr:DUF4277 domain-containing protein [Bacillota bacterium]